MSSPNRLSKKSSIRPLSSSGRGTRPSLGHPLCFSFSRRVHEVVGQSFKAGATGNIFTCQVAGSRNCIGKKEHKPNMGADQAVPLRPFGRARLRAKVPVTMSSTEPDRRTRRSSEPLHAPPHKQRDVESADRYEAPLRVRKSQGSWYKGQLRFPRIKAAANSSVRPDIAFR